MRCIIQRQLVLQAPRKNAKRKTQQYQRQLGEIRLICVRKVHKTLSFSRSRTGRASSFNVRLCKKQPPIRWHKRVKRKPGCNLWIEASQSRLYKAYDNGWSGRKSLRFGFRPKGIGCSSIVLLLFSLRVFSTWFNGPERCTTNFANRCPPVRPVSGQVCFPHRSRADFGTAANPLCFGLTP